MRWHKRIFIRRVLVKPEANYFEAILNATTESIFLVDVSGTLLAINDIAASRLHHTRAEMEGKSIFDFFPSEVAESRRNNFFEVARSGVARYTEDQRGDRHFSMNYYPIKDAGGTVEAIAVYATDITTRKVAEKALRDSESRYRRFAEELPLGIVITQDGLIKYTNLSTAQMLGYQVNELLEKPFLPLVCEDDRPRLLDLHRRRMAGEVIHPNYDVGMIRKDGELRHWSMHASTIEWDGKPSALGSCIDITERRLRERELQLTQQRLTFAQRAANAGLWDWELNTDTMYWSPEMCSLFGIDSGTGEVSLATWRSAVHPEDIDRARGRTLDAIRGATALTNEYRIVLPNGSIRWIAAYGNTMCDAQGKAIRMSGISIDVSERYQLETALRESEERYRNAFMVSPDAVNITSLTDGRYLEVSDGFCRMLGWSRDEVIGKTSIELGIWANKSDRKRFMETLRRDGSYTNLEANFVGKDGRVVTGLMSAHSMVMKGERCLLSVTRDITERKLADDKLKLAASVFSHAREGIIITNVDGCIIDVNETFTDITGYTKDEVIGKNPRMLSSGRQTKEFYTAMWKDLKEKGHWYGEIWNQRKDGEVFPEALTISSVRNSEGETKNYVAIFSDITAQKAHQGQLEHIAHFDALTNLPNRVLLADRLQQAMSQAQRRQQRLAVAYLDLDGFKAINDRHGHHVGDQLLVAISAGMKHVLREGDTLARLGGDEFVAVLIDLDTDPNNLAMLDRLLQAAAQREYVGDVCLQVSASLGVTFYPQAEEIDADQLLRQADQAMYQAKLGGKNRYFIFDATHDSTLRVRRETLERIRLALDTGEFVLHYQPKVDMRSGRVVGAEALIRWQHPERGLLAPGVFLPVIEDHPLAVDVGEWVIDTALKQAQSWSEVGFDIPVSVNIGARQLQQDNFVERLERILADNPKAKPSQLELEILETSALEDVAQVSSLIESCARIGLKFALDDFGTGYSSLTYLKRLKVDVLKIDQSFVRDMLEDSDDLAILEGVIGLAAAFKREVIAEGVESVEHGAMLLKLGCVLAQGFGIARPMPAHELLQWAQTWRPDPSWSEIPDSFAS
jgi:diguanylate cyclase (GGDEF)-like protein/PAS domain S-box-containing protein